MPDNRRQRPQSRPEQQPTRFLAGDEAQRKPARRSTTSARRQPDTPRDHRPPPGAYADPARDPAWLQETTVAGADDRFGQIDDAYDAWQDRAGAGRAAEEFSSDRMLRPRVPKPKRGWRNGIYRATRGLVNPGPSDDELYERELMQRVKTPFSGTRRIAVISRKGGVGKTTTTLMLGHTFAKLRGDRVIAFDGNPDAGSLGYRVTRETDKNIIDLLNESDEIRRYADIRSFTSQAPTRLEVLAGSDDPGIIDGLGEDGYRRIADLLEYHYNLTCMDTGTGVLESATQGILGLADQVVVVMAPSLDSARTAASTLDWLEQNGHEELVYGAVAVVNSTDEQESLVEVDRIDDHFLARCRDLIHIPRDEQLEAGGETDLDDLQPETQEAYLELAAAVADGFVESRTHSDWLGALPQSR